MVAAVLERLQERARAGIQSVEQVAREILRSALAVNRAERLAAIDRIRAMTPPPLDTPSADLIREGRSMTALPPTCSLHLWWARRPLVDSRAAVSAARLPADTGRERFMRVLDFRGDPVAVWRRLDHAIRSGRNLGTEPYGY